MEIDELLALTGDWNCSPNLHFAHMSQNLVYPSPEVSLREYLAFWQEHQTWIRQVKDEQFGDLLDLLESNGLLTGADREEFGTEFFETNRSTVNVCPGISMHYWWDRPRALDLDDNDFLMEEADERVREAVRTWGAESAWKSVLEGTREETKRNI